ncbi:MAG: DUF4091 domain-containing protein [Acidobacteriota bacterium]
MWMRSFVLTMAVLIPGSLVGAVEPAVQVWAVPSVQKVRPDDPVESDNLVWSSQSKTIAIAGARNEHVPVQMVLSTPPPPTRYDPAAGGFFVKVSDLEGQGGKIPRDQIRLFLEHVVLCYAKSSPVGSTGFWPDALAPLTDPFDMQAEFRSFVKNRGVWIDVRVPETAGAGKYVGWVEITQNGRAIDQLSLHLTVYDFTLPRETHLITYMNISRSWLARGYGIDRDSEEATKLLRSYYQFLYANRMEPWFHELLQPDIELESGGDVRVKFDPALYRHYLDELGTKRVILEVVPDELRQGEPDFSEKLTQRVRSYLQQVGDFFKKNQWTSRLVLNSPIDEPDTAQHYADTRRWAALVHESIPGVPFLATESPVPDRPEWGVLTGAVQNFSMHGNALNRPAVKAAIREEQAKGGEMTWYISCDQVFPQPNYFIDAPAMDPVMVPWITWRYRMNGILYWALNYWPQTPDPWLDPVTFLSGFLCSKGYVLNGEGSLLYPGHHVQRQTGQRNVEGPVSSIRFELLREGIEDYEYLWLLKALGDAAFADRAVEEMVVDVSSFSRNVEELFAWRQKMARRIEVLRKASPSGAGNGNGSQK